MKTWTGSCFAKNVLNTQNRGKRKTDFNFIGNTLGTYFIPYLYF